MCVAIPMKVVDVVDDFCTVELNGVRKKCYIGMVEGVPETGDYLLVHAGMGIRVLEKGEEEEILKNLSFILGGELEQ